MDYRKEYLQLKQQIRESNNMGVLNPRLVNDLTNMVFVANDNILEDDAHAVILSLIEEFNKLTSNNALTDNLEISKYYDVGKGLKSKEGNPICENCELVLKYSDTTVCVSNGRVRHDVAQEGDKYYHKNKAGQKKEIDCELSRGLVKFYIKQKENLGSESQYKYTKIEVVKVESTESLCPYQENVYQNVNEMDKLDAAAVSAVSRGQTEAITRTARENQLDVASSKGVASSIKTVNKINTAAKNAAVQTQVSKLNNGRVASEFPNQSSVNAANTVSKIIMNTNAAKDKNLSVVLVPGEQAISIQVDPNVTTVSATIDNNGISMRGGQNGNDTLNTSNINNRASMAVDANLAVIPYSKIASDNTVSIAEASKKSTTAIKNKINQYGNLIADQIDELGNEVVGFFRNKDAMNKVKTDAESAVSKAQNYVQHTVDQAKGSINKSMEKYNNTGMSVEKGTADVRNAASRAKNSVVKSVEQAKNIDRSDVEGVITKAKNTVGSAIEEAKTDINKAMGQTKNVNKTGVQEAIDKARDNVGKALGDARTDIEDAIAQGKKYISSVVPVSENLSVMSSVPSKDATNLVPVPTNENVTQTASSVRLENKLAKGAMPIQQSKTASEVVQNGKASLSLTEQRGGKGTKSVNKKSASYRSTTQYTTGLPSQQKTEKTISKETSTRNKNLITTETSDKHSKTSRNKLY